MTHPFLDAYRRGIPDAAQEEAAVVRRAISDPGSLLPRLPDESITNWQTRAVLAALTDMEASSA